MPDQVTLYNQALSLAGSKSSVSSLTENSREVEVCNLWYDEARRSVLSAAFWPSARKFQALAVLKERDFNSTWTEGDPSPPFKFAYALPSEMLRPRYIDNFARFSVDLLSPTSRALMSDQEDALLYFTLDQKNIALWDAQLYTAVVHLLAHRIQMPLHAKERRAQMLFSLATEIILEARATTANELQNMQIEVLPEWIQVRGYGGGARTWRYVYPYADINAIGSQVTTSTLIQNVVGATGA